MPITLQIRSHKATLNLGEWSFDPESSSLSRPILKLYDQGRADAPWDAYGHVEAERVAGLIGAKIVERSHDVPKAGRQQPSVPV